MAASQGAQGATERALLVGFVLHVFCGESSKPLLRVLLFLLVVGGVAAGIGYLLGPMALAIAGGTGIAGAGVRELVKRKGAT